MHGGNIYKYTQKYGHPPMDFSANISPYPLPEGVRSAILDSMDQISAYPDPDCTLLRKAIAKKHLLQKEDILCGAGALDLIQRFICALSPKKALIIDPAFSEYESILKLYDCRILSHMLNSGDDFCLHEDILDSITPDLDLLILNFPHNPTGRVPGQELLRALVSQCKKHDVYILSDESFIDFLPDPDAASLFNHPYERIMVIRAFTKYYGLAGLRLGYAISHDKILLEKMKTSGPAWNVSTPAQVAGIALMKEDYDIRLTIRDQRDRMYAALSSMGFKVIDGQANFLLFFSDIPSLGKKLEAYGILIRDCSDFKGLSRGWYRIAIKTPDETSALLDALEKITSQS